MSFSKVALLLSVVAAVAAAPTPADSVSPIPGYEIVTPQWKIEVTPGNFETFNGTVQEVLAQVLEKHPSLQETFDQNVAEAEATADVELSSEALSKRSTVSCNPRPNEWRSARAAEIEAGVRYLRGIGGNAVINTGCSRVSCSYQSAIYACNDNKSKLTLSNWGAVANSAQHTVNVCKYWGPSFPYDAYLVVGQNFEASNWNTIVRSDVC